MQTQTAIPKGYGAIDYNDLVREFVSNMGFPCVGAKTALTKDQVHICVADSIFSTQADNLILTGLYDFIANYKRDKAVFRSFVVVFNDMHTMSEEDFEAALWTRLQSLHDKDIYPWDTAVSEDPEDHKFSFSAGNKSFYIVGMHPGTSASDRRFPLPALVFNLHEQFEELQAAEKHPSMKRLTRRRDKTLLNLAADTYQANGHIRSTQKESIYEANDQSSFGNSLFTPERPSLENR